LVAGEFFEISIQRSDNDSGEGSFLDRGFVKSSNISPVRAFEQSRPAADASRKVNGAVIA
jgi:hypothetical protein